MIAAIVVAWLVEAARGHESNPYGRLAALAGGTYLVGVAVGRLRS